LFIFSKHCCFFSATQPLQTTLERCGEIYVDFSCFFPDAYHFPDLSVHPVAFSVDHLGGVLVCDAVERDGMVCDCGLVLLHCCESAV